MDEVKELYLLVDNVRSVYNVGSIFRTCGAVGISKIFLSGISGVEKFGQKVRLHPKVLKTALDGANVPWEYCADPVKKLKKLKEMSVEIISLEITDKSQNYTKVKYSTPLCLVVGHERSGVQDSLLKAADKIISIPMMGKGKSLNVSVATGVALFEIRRQIG
jgi:tRNA G18 (ribose-2'-O)-methylase SpoU